ncbi:hypothetical protein RJ55_04519 [Drechmeria coniospora]|nr:hypothetical protein RJ55_04519 [Drechmeria coniospora]
MSQPATSRPPCTFPAREGHAEIIDHLTAFPHYKYGTKLSDSLASLCPEILNLILNHARMLHPECLFSLRLVCRRFNSVITPVAYHTIELNDTLLSPRARYLQTGALALVFQYCRHVIVRSDLHPSRVTRVLSQIQSLESIRFRYVAQPCSVSRSWFPSEVLDLDKILQCGTQLHVENLPISSTRRDLDDAYFDDRLAKHLVSLKMSHSDPPLTTRSGSLKHLIMHSPNLRTLHYRDLGIGTNFCFHTAERMPPLVDLVLKSYNWQHSADSARRHWDFSKMRSLKLIDIPTSNFLDSVHLPDFALLETLEVKDYGGHLQDTWPSATRRLYDLVGHHVRALKTLDVTCHTKLFGLDAIRQHGLSLQVLRFRDHVGFEHDSKRCPTLSPVDLALLSAQLTRLHTLELDMDVSPSGLGDFLAAVASFPRLDTLTLHVQTCIRSLTSVDQRTDPDYHATIDLLNRLLCLRASLKGRRSWRRITINVGGWRPAMVRRVGHDWKQRNREGVFAERCFVLERNRRGLYEIREEEAFESSRRRSPIQL